MTGTSQAKKNFRENHIGVGGLVEEGRKSRGRGRFGLGWGTKKGTVAMACLKS